MSLLIIVRVALKALGRNKLRTALTMLGMIIGVAAVITMVGLGRGAQEEIETQIQAAGANLIRVRAGNFRRGGVSMGIGGAPTLTAADIDAIREQVPGAQYLSASVSTRDQVVAGSRNWATQIEGADVELPLIRQWNVDYGTFFDATHVARRRQGRGPRAGGPGQPVRPGRRPGRRPHPHPEPVVSGHRRHGVQGPRAPSARIRTT